MSSKLSQWGVLALALSVSAGAASQNSVPLADEAPALQGTPPPNNKPVASKVPSQTGRRTTAAALDRLASVTIAPPILRSAGDTVLTPDPPLLGRLRLPNQALGRLPLEQPPTINGAPHATGASAGAGIGDVGQAH